jgi:hypothetical protein
LARYNRYYNNELQKAIANAPSGESLNRSSWLGRKFIAMMSPDNRKKQTTLKRLNPINSRLDVLLLDEFISHQHELLTLIATCSSKSIDKHTIPVEFFKLLRIQFLDALEFVVVHEQRHVLQMQGVLEKILNEEAVLKV